MMMDRPLEDDCVVEDCHFVGRRNPESLLQCNTYLRTFGGASGKPYHWCVDPGSVADYDVVRANLLGHVGSLAEIDLVSMNHQDPDVVGNLPALVAQNDSLLGLVTEDAWRLIRHLGARPRELSFADPTRLGMIRLPGGHQVFAVPTPFCHFRGAVAFFDPETRILFSGDLFGGLNVPGRTQMWGEEEDWTGIAIFHQIYMPTSVALAYAIEQIRALSPAVEIIAPQHGFLLRGDFMHAVLERLERLPVGMDRLPRDLDEKHMETYQEAFRHVIELATDQLGRKDLLDRIRDLDQEDALAPCIRVDQGSVELQSKGIVALPRIVEVLGRGQPASFGNRLRMAALDVCRSRNAPLPAIVPGLEDNSSDDWIG